MHDERNFYRMVALDMLKDAWTMYNRKVDSVVVVLREHGFSEEEISLLIEVSRN